MDEDFGGFAGSEAELVAGETDDTGNAGLHHFDQGTAAQAELFEPLNAFRPAAEVADPGGFASP